MRPRICAVIVDNDIDAVHDVESLVDLFEVRMDLIGAGWREVVKQLGKPWIACNRSASEGGKAGKNRIDELLEASELGADIVDLELRTKGLEEIVPRIKKKSKCLLSYHNLKNTLSLSELGKIVEAQLKAGADICKVVTTAHSFDDNITVLELISRYPGTKIVAFAMGDPGVLSRVLCPLAGGYFTYASIQRGKESAPGQITVARITRLYQMVQK